MLGFAGYFVALDRAPNAAATVVYYTYPVVVLLISAALWKRPLRRTEVLVCSMIVAGVALCVGPLALSGDVMVALLPAFAAPVGWAIFLIVLSGPVGAMPTLPKMFAGSCGGAIALFPIAIWRTGGALMPLTAPALSAMALLTLCTLAIPGILVSWGAARAGDRATAMIGSLEFVVALGVSWILTGASLDRLQLVGIAGIVLAAAVGSRTANGETVLNSTDGGGAHNASDDREEVPLLAGVCDRSVGRAAACS